MAQESTTDVLICGAGAAGLGLAIDLARRGVDFRLIDKAEAPFRGSRGKGIQPRSQEVFEDYGILDRLFATEARIRRSVSTNRTGVLSTSRSATPPAPPRRSPITHR